MHFCFGINLLELSLNLGILIFFKRNIIDNPAALTNPNILLRTKQNWWTILTQHKNNPKLFPKWPINTVYIDQGGIYFP